MRPSESHSPRACRGAFGVLRSSPAHRRESARWQGARRGQPGEVVTHDLIVACGEGALKLMKVQRAGKGVMEARELLKGFPLPAGTKLG